MKDILGTALLDYLHGNYSEDIVTETSISEPDVLPLPYLFRSFEKMPKMEQLALHRCEGNVLDVGCGAGSHSLYLQGKGVDVMAIDASAGAVAVARERGVRQVLHSTFLDLSGVKFDTILLLMNGTGIFETVAQVPQYLEQLHSLLSENGSVLIDSSDLRYMYDETHDGGIWVPADRYYGELEFTMEYKGQTTAHFPWLYLDQRLLAELCEENGFNFEILYESDHYEYLAKLTLK
ncbi:MAG: SAM-dependent methyltransferase [Flavobacteriaceae bacterium]|nr:SAM-dependent methyltransferase [Flavobacteriaceae bacterium]